MNEWKQSVQQQIKQFHPIGTFFPALKLSGELEVCSDKIQYFSQKN